MGMHRNAAPQAKVPSPTQPAPPTQPAQAKPGTAFAFVVVLLTDCKPTHRCWSAAGGGHGLPWLDKMATAVYGASTEDMDRQRGANIPFTRFEVKPRRERYQQHLKSGIFGSNIFTTQ